MNYVAAVACFVLMVGASFGSWLFWTSNYGWKPVAISVTLFGLAWLFWYVGWWMWVLA